ncbi:hypothetical protein IFM89_039334 [Coptis chinensis]|uniref:ACB domain-containing protein n=1 Tax=Coptis chinensis TaxID=261450 RepID=A0A835HN81_9MAGN|nr:hypothetical protein IFM89_039334 [Coptis chinensis]
MRKMREHGYPISHLVFNRLITLHSSPGRKKAIPRILAQMKADKVAPHVSTYNILLKIEADGNNIESLTKVFGEMKRANVEPNEITYCILATAHSVARLYSVTEVYVEEIEKSKTGNNWSTLDVLLILYGYLGKEDDLERTLGVIQKLPHVRYKSFVLAIEAFGRLGRLDRAEELWLEMKSTKQLKSTEHFNSIISVYCRRGLIDKASEVFKEMETNGCRPNAITYRHLTLGCLKAGLVEEALKALEVGMDQTITSTVKRSTPWLETTLLVVELFADRGDVENVKRLFTELKEARYSRAVSDLTFLQGENDVAKLFSILVSFKEGNLKIVRLEDDDWDETSTSTDLLDEEFNAATTFITCNVLKEGFVLSNEVILELFGLYKIATHGPCNDAHQPSPLKMVLPLIDMQKNKDGDYEASSSAAKELVGPVFSTFLHEDSDDLLWKLQLIHASSREGEINNLLKCIDSGTSVNLKDSEGRTPLHWAVDRGHLKVAELLVSKKADVNIKDNEGQTPLHYASVCEKQGIAEFLVNHGADKKLKDNDGYSP